MATHDPARTEIHRLLHALNLNRFELQYAPESMLLEIIGEAFPQKNKYLDRLGEDLAFDLGTSYDEGQQLVDEEALEAEISRSKLINLFEAMLVEAVRAGASDIHLFPNASRHVEIHFRIDGELEPWHVEERIHPEAFLAVAKDNAVNVDRFERDAAQDGAIQRRIDDALIRFRVSVLPTVTAEQNVRSESIVIRVLDDRKVVKDLAKLGLNQLALDRFHHAIRQPYGMVILTGPTGSGKTTTLYAALHEVVTPKINVLTAEDPVEYILPGVRQIKLSHKLQLESALRSILRHDPDVVMVGEMRDRPTAELAIKLANTGHLTFSTLHTNDAPSAVSRLYKMGIEPFLIAYAINLVVAQRLIRVLCPACKIEETPDDALLERMGFSKEDIASSTFYTHAPSDSPCKKCGDSGYSGRRAISETMLFTPEIRHIIVAADELVDEDKLRKTATEQGMLTLQASARERVRNGETSIQEMMRVVFTDF
jgi:type IV pilus assembly protein PilB